MLRSSSNSGNSCCLTVKSFELTAYLEIFADVLRVAESVAYRETWQVCETDSVERLLGVKYFFELSWDSFKLPVYVD